MKAQLSNIHTNFDGFSQLVTLNDIFESCVDGECVVDVGGVGWLDANMCSPFGAIIRKHLVGGKNIQILGIQENIREIWRKNGFSDLLGWTKTDDTWKTTIKYRSFDREDNTTFQDYIATHFKPGAHGLPIMSEALLKRFRASLFEIYDNAVHHSETSLGIFACGQQFPKNSRLDFSIADLGIGMQQRIWNSKNMRFSALEAIEWAMSGNTTRQKEDGRPGGLGLRLLRDFIELNGGKIVTVSGIGYWELKRNKETMKPFVIQKTLDHPFPGTVVTIEINTADILSYRLASEVSADNIF